MKRLFALIVVILLTSSAFGQESTSEPMSFEKCVLSIQMLATQLGIAPINIVETTQMRMVRFPTSDGSVLVTCSKPDQKRVITVNKN